MTNKGKIGFSKGFRKEFEKLPDIHKKMVMDTVLLIEENPSYPSLRTKKMGGKHKYYESSANMDIRILWRYRRDGDGIALLDVGHHDVLRKY